MAAKIPMHIPVLAILIATVPCRSAAAQDERGPSLPGKNESIGRTIVLDGSCVMNRGNLQMNVTNFGFIGSLPKSRYPMADMPSAQWPAGSGIEYLYAAGIWIGAEVNGVQSVSTGYPETEFYPARGPVDRIYRTMQGDPGGRTYPQDPDDDGDGRIDEDWMNGRDDDGDGRIDEDFAGFGKLMFSCEYRDDDEIAQEVWPEHTPFGVGVRQETFQWSEDRYDDFVGAHYAISNIGTEILNGVYVGIYADLDAGPRDRPNYHKDDGIGSWSGIWCADQGSYDVPVRMSVVYVYDADGDDGLTSGYFGIVLLESRQTIPGWPVPTRHSTFNGLRIFAGLLPFALGGEPVNDSQRYSCLASMYKSPNTTQPNDYRAVFSVGPFNGFIAETDIALDIAFVCGEGLEALLDNAAMATYVYNGVWCNADNDFETGKWGRETPLPGPLEMIDPDPCDDNRESLNVAKGDTLWVNMDCVEEDALYKAKGCNAGGRPKIYFQTGVHGCEKNVNWVVSMAPIPPSMRVVPRNNAVDVFWDDLSEVTADAVTGANAFEGYRVWRADDWHRPLGTTERSGPGNDLWHLLASCDRVNGIAPDVDLDRPVEQGGFLYTPLRDLPGREAFLESFAEILAANPGADLPCPPGLSGDECDTLAAIARSNLGLEGGHRYYEYLDREVKNGMPYFYAVVAYEFAAGTGQTSGVGRTDTPYSNFVYATPRSDAQEAEDFREGAVYVVPNPVTRESSAPWTLAPNNADPSGEKAEFRNLPKCVCTVRIYTLAGDLVETLQHDGRGGDGSLRWNLVSRNGQSVTSGVYLFAVEPEDRRFPRVVGKFAVIR